MGAFLLAASFSLYAHTLNYPFHFDDRIFLDDGNVLAANWSRFLWPPVPRALVWLSYTLQTAIQPQDPVAFRTLNVTLHGLNAFLVFLLLRDLISRTEVAGLRRLWPALLGAVIFLVHPLQTESDVYQRSTERAATGVATASLHGQWLLVGCVTRLFFPRNGPWYYRY